MENQRIVCAACKCPETGIVILGARHFDSLMRDQIERMRMHHKQVNSLVEGFVDIFGNFLTRKQAFVIAKEKGQIIRRCGGDEGCLYPENLY